jgi:hypothetical protein
MEKSQLNKRNTIQLPMKSKKIILVVGSALVLLPSLVTAQILYSQNFDVNDSANWNVNSGGGASVNTANIFFDYSTVGIPSAPHSTGGTTLGVKLNANNTVAGQALGGVSVSPTGQSFTGDYQLRFDMWLNFIGPAPAGGSGSTQITGAGIGTSGTSANYAGSVDGIWFAGTGEGGSAADYRVYTPAASGSLPSGNTVYAAPGGAINNSAAYYTAAFPARTAPAAQITLYPSQTGSAAAGTLGWAWHNVTILKLGNKLTWNIDGTLMASLDISTNGVLGGNNILLMQGDINATASTDANGPTLNFGLFDNVVITAVPEPATYALAVLGASGLFLARRRSRKV